MSQSIENDNDLGEPDFSAFLDDDTAEVQDHHVKSESTKQQSLPVGEVIAMTTGMLFSFVATRKGDHWRLSPDEGEQIAETSQQCVDQYMPDFEMSPLWLLAGVTTGIFAPRLLLDMKIQQQAAEKEQADNEPERNQATEHSANEQ